MKATILLAILSAPGAGDLDALKGPEPPALRSPHFPRPLDEFVFRNWGVVPAERIAACIDAKVEDVRALALSMGLGQQPLISPEIWRRSHITVIRRNWHLLPYEQLLRLLGWDEAKLAYMLREDDFLWVKLGLLKPKCPPLAWEPLPDSLRPRQDVIRATVGDALGPTGISGFRRRFAFLDELAATAEMRRRTVEKAATGEVDLTRGWKIRLPEGAGDVARGAAERFSRYLVDAMDARAPEIVSGRGGGGTEGPDAAGVPSPAISPGRVGDGPAGGVIETVIDPAAFEKPESHEIVVEPGRVRIAARDEVGILRALDRLKDRFEERGGPFLSPGRERRDTRFDLRYLYSYFALYGDPLLEPDLDPYPDGYLEKLARLGVNGVWLQAVLRNLVPEPGSPGRPAVPFPEFGEGSARRLESLRKLVARARRYGIGIFLYLNEPRAMPESFFAGRPGLAGAVEGGLRAVCTSAPETREFISSTLAHVLKEVPDLGGVFTISMSENLTSCWSHGQGKGCPRCGARPGPEVVAEVNRAVHEGVRRSSATARTIAWDWGWPDDWIEPIIAGLPPGMAVQSVSEWSLPIRRAGIDSTVGEYSISAVGPGPRATRSWAAAKKAGRPAIAKVQVGNTWELSAVPYIPAVRLVAEHTSRLSSAGVDGLMLGWTLGGCPSPNLEAAAQYYFGEAPGVDEALRRVALRRFGLAASKAVDAWKTFGEAFVRFPYGLGLYTAPQQMGPANILYPKETGYRATMVCYPYDDLESWRGVYPAEVLAAEFGSIARDWEKGISLLRDDPELDPSRRLALVSERRVAIAAWVHFRSVAAQAGFVIARRAYAAAKERSDALARLDQMRGLLLQEIDNARKLLHVCRDDARIGFEATNCYYYVPGDLVEKVVNCRWLLEDWLPAEKKRREEAK
jgi:hypothetical protein